MDDKQEAPVTESLENIGCDLAKELSDSIRRRELWLPIIMSVLRKAARTTDLKKVEADLSELRDNHLPKVEAALSRANKMGAEADRIIMDMAEHLRLAVQAIEGGEHHGNGSYTQRFGQTFLERLKKSQEQIRVVPPEHRRS